MKTSKTLFFLLGALLAALLTWWLAGDKQAAAGTSAVGMPAAGISAAGLPAAGERSALDVIATRTSVRAYRDCPVGADTVELLLRAALAGLRVRSAQTTTASGADAAILAYCRESANFWSSALSSTTTKTHGWRFMAEGAAIAARSSSSTVSAPTGQSR